MSSSVRAHAAKMASFLVVGGAAFVVDAVVFNLLTFWVTGRGPLFDQPLLAKTIAIVLASVATYVGNRYWTFARRRLRLRFSRYVMFAVLNLVAIGIQLGCLAFSRHVLGLEGPIPDNISGTLIGQALATIFRYLTYDRLVFREDEGDPELLTEETA
ncbi:GtrA family protein [Microbacterium sp. 1P10AE]|uniref:GtrA family protein n=1 Tax=Microbacterium sp. 1P10AE TaxID=3132286 RepID=UPI0039A17CA6